MAAAVGAWKPASNKRNRISLYAFANADNKLTAPQENET
jgi:hypothetical protein